jgi:hypothetical protein
LRKVFSEVEACGSDNEIGYNHESNGRSGTSDYEKVLGKQIYLPVVGVM